MQGIIVLDGPDGAGKTTLAKHLVDTYGAKYIHLTYRWKDAMPLYHFAAIDRAIKLSQNNLVVIDRWWMSELCYANAYRGGTRWPYMGRILDRIALKYGLIYVYLLSENIRESIDAYETLKTQRSEMYSDILPAAMEYYCLWKTVQHWPHVIRYSKENEGTDIPLFSERLISKLQNWRAAQWQPALDPTNKNILGHIDSARILICDDRTSQYKGHPWYPLVANTKENQYLTSVLAKAGIQEHEIMYTGYEPGSPIVQELMGAYDLQLITLSSGTVHQCLIDAGAGAQAFKKLNNPQSVVHPAYDLKHRRGRTLRYELTSAILRTEAYANI